MNLSHFTYEPLLSVRSVEQRFDSPNYRSCYEKPRGLWVSVDGPDDWSEYCVGSGMEVGEKRYCVTLASDPRVLILDSGSALYNFTDRYGKTTVDQFRRERYIDWPMVAGDYRGIIIAPYVWSCRMDEYTRWYYGWDCASGCIWNPSAVASITQSLRSEAA